jgi:hypothetical protein
VRGIKQWEGLPGPARRLGRGEVRRPARQGEDAAVGVRHDDFDEVADPMDVADRQGVAIQGMNRVANGDASRRSLELMGSLRIASRRCTIGYANR